MTGAPTESSVEVDAPTQSPPSPPGPGDIDAGLTSAVASARLAEFGPNRLPEAPLPGLTRIFLRQFASPFIYILLIAAAASLALSQVPNAVFIQVSGKKLGDRNIIYRLDSDRDSCGICSTPNVTHDISEAVSGIEVGNWSVGE